MSSSETTQSWIKFFKDAGIPTSEAHNYAISFTKHRIQMAMLADLNKEYLNDMGITMMGDIISILKHAKDIAQQASQEEALKLLSPDRPRTPNSRRSTAASRTVAHYLPKDENAGLMSEPMVPTPKISKGLAARLGPVNDSVPKARTIATMPTPSPNITRIAANKLKKTAMSTSSAAAVVRLARKQKEEVPVPKSRRVLPEHEGKYKIKMPAGTTPKTRKILEKQLQAEMDGSPSSSVFDRLGESDSPTPGSSSFKVTGLDNFIIRKAVSSTPESSVFDRLGGNVLKRPATSTVPDSSESEEDGPQLEYQGILKQSSAKKKKMQISSNIKIQKTIIRDLPKKEPENTLNTEGIFSPFANHIKKSAVTDRLGSSGTDAVVAEAQTTTPSQRSKKAINDRLGAATQKEVQSQKSKGVFSRLGKQV